MQTGAHRRLSSTRSVATSLMTISLLAIASSDAGAMGANPAQFVPIAQCPPLKSYTPAQSKQIGEARKRMRTADPKNILLELSDDYLILRDQCRAYGAQQ